MRDGCDGTLKCTRGRGGLFLEQCLIESDGLSGYRDQRTGAGKGWVRISPGCLVSKRFRSLCSLSFF